MTVKEAIKQAAKEIKSGVFPEVANLIEYRATELIGGVNHLTKEAVTAEMEAMPEDEAFDLINHD